MNATIHDFPNGAQDQAPDAPPKRVSAREIIASVSRETMIGPRDILSNARFPHIVRARQRIYAELRAAGWSYPKIGMVMGRDHKTVLDGVRAHKAREAKHGGRE